MCGIACILNVKRDAERLRETAMAMARRLRHRGPDWSGIYADEQAVLAHERLAIVDVEHGAQPLRSAQGDLVLAVNGEIYNHRQLAAGLAAPYPFATRSDCEVILPLYAERGVELLDRLSGIFAFVLYDRRRGTALVARDPIGVEPLFLGWDEAGNLYVASELKALVGPCRRIEDFPPGHYLLTGMSEPVRYYHPGWRGFEAVAGNPLDLGALRASLEASVRRQLMCDVPYGVLVSGGLDSSVIAAITQKLAPNRTEEDDRSPAWWPRVHSFAIGLDGSPDLAAAARVAAALGTVHHAFRFTVQEGIDALRDVVFHIESYDVTTVRASTPMYLMARKIKAMGIKMVLSGEGADEIFGGYLYFHKAPSARAFHEETVRKLDLLYKYDCLRANKSTAAWGLETRVPYLDREFLDVAMAFDPAAKMVGPGRMEKYPLRQAFEGYLPAEILWRQKEQFSDGVGYAWIDSLKAFAGQKVSDAQLAEAVHRFPVNTPATKEAYLYRELFESHFPLDSAVACIPGGPSVACSTSVAIAWDSSFRHNADPSGRSVRDVHRAPE
ncbi:MAG: asparagine synthase B [Deltaproteobacteria bacterium]|nr:asparagine synthase B [Deltaproteobacteria bacterium]